MNIQDIRKEYTQHSLNETDVVSNPLQQFERWFDQALKAQVMEANAFNLTTIDSDGKPHSRMVLLKGLTDKGFEFFTNYNSHKAQQIQANPWVSMTFFWPELERQVRVEGRASKISKERSQEYFFSRPHQSQLGAWASNQSEILSSRTLLEDRLEDLNNEFPEGTKVPFPTHWGGFEIEPNMIEFWQGRASRLHDRIRYTQEGPTWSMARLSP
jgi:pyridoxamine 5'-phosphate oxidase